MKLSDINMGETVVFKPLFGEPIECTNLYGVYVPKQKPVHTIEELFERDMVDTLSYDYRSLIKNGGAGLLGVEAATAYWGLSSFAPDEPIFLMKSNDEEVKYYQYQLSFLFSKYVNLTNVVKLSDTLSVTDKEQTVCDMIRFDRQEFHLFETLISAYDGDVDIERLEKLADSYGILDKMKCLVEEAYKECEY